MISQRNAAVQVVLWTLYQAATSFGQALSPFGSSLDGSNSIDTLPFLVGASPDPLLPLEDPLGRIPGSPSVTNEEMAGNSQYQLRSSEPQAMRFQQNQPQFQPNPIPSPPHQNQVHVSDEMIPACIVDENGQPIGPMGRCGGSSINSIKAVILNPLQSKPKEFREQVMKNPRVKQAYEDMNLQDKQIKTEEEWASRLQKIINYLLVKKKNVAKSILFRKSRLRKLKTAVDNSVATAQNDRVRELLEKAVGDLSDSASQLVGNDDENSNLVNMKETMDHALTILNGALSTVGQPVDKGI